MGIPTSANLKVNGTSMTETKKITPSDTKEPMSKDLEELSSVPDGEDSIFENSSPRSREIMRRAVLEAYLAKKT